MTTKQKKLGRSEKARLNSTRVRAKSGETPENKTNGISTYNELVDQWSLFQSNKHLYVACWNICTLVCRLLKHLRPGSRFLIGKKCAWSLDHLFKSSWSLHFFLRVKGRIGTVRSWSFDFRSLEMALISWLALKTGFDHLIQFWSWSQTLLHGIYKWLPLEATTLAVQKCSTQEEESGNKASWEMILPLSVIGVVWVLVDELLHPQWGVQPKALGSLPTLQTGYPCSTGKERNTNSKSTQVDISEWREARWGFNRWWNVTQLDKI